MNNVKLTVDLSSQDEALTVAGALTELLVPPPDAQTMFEVGRIWRVEAYFSASVDQERMSTWMSQLTGASPVDFSWTDVPDVNWVALSQAGLPPVQAGRFRIYGEHDRARVARGPYSLEIAAGEAFGTAHHATTHGCLEAIDRLTRRRRFKSVIDIGCGTGILALAASRALPRAHITATDVDPVAIDVARANARLNGAARRIVFACRDGLGPHGGLTRHDLLIANILAGPLIDLATRIRRALRPGAHVVLSGILSVQAGRVAAAYRTAEFEVVDTSTTVGWTTLVLRRTGVRPLTRTHRR